MLKQISAYIKWPNFLAISTIASLFVIAFMANLPVETKLVVAIGGTNPVTPIQIQEATIKQLRAQQFIRQNQANILRHQIKGLEVYRNQQNGKWNAELEQKYRQSIGELTELLRDEHNAEQQLLTSLNQIWEAQAAARSLSNKKYTGPINLGWPVLPTEGLSAIFNDAGYKERFGFEHKAIDIPIEQGNVIRAAAAGTVQRVTDNGDGYNSMSIDHNGFVTVYGHVLKFLVTKDQTVERGQAIGISGGLPGTPGAGNISTGAHVHLELWSNGVRIDPLPHLPKI